MTVGLVFGDPLLICDPIRSCQYYDMQTLAMEA